MKSKNGIKLCCLLLCSAMLLGVAGCVAPTIPEDTKHEAPSQPVAQQQNQPVIQPNDRAADTEFVRSQMAFALKIFRSMAESDQKNNVLVSPLSIQLALAMTANGADGLTRAEMEALLGEDIQLDALNEYLHTYINTLPSTDESMLKAANSIWMRNQGLQVKEEFLQRNKAYFNAEINQSAFDEQTLQQINSWVHKNTDGMIDRILDSIDGAAMMYLINTILFDAQWQTNYTEEAISKGTFTDLNGNTKDITMMFSQESKYLDDGKATGFIKNYAGGDYSFAVLLPNADVDIYDYIAGLTNDGLLDTLQNAKSGSVIASMPKFTCQYGKELKQILSYLGMPTAFEEGKAEFHGIGTLENGNLYISEVLHKTYISVDGMGTRAGAATAVIIAATGALQPDWQVILDRPFVYMILDNANHLPIFMGIAADIAE